MKLNLSKKAHTEAQIAFLLCPKNCNLLCDSSCGTQAMYHLSLHKENSKMNHLKTSYIICARLHKSSDVISLKYTDIRRVF